MPHLSRRHKLVLGLSFLALGLAACSSHSGSARYGEDCYGTQCEVVGYYVYPQYQVTPPPVVTTPPPPPPVIEFTCPEGTYKDADGNCISFPEPEPPVYIPPPPVYVPPPSYPEPKVPPTTYLPPRK